MSGIPSTPKALINKGFLIESAGARTQDPQIKSLLLYQLSYALIAIASPYRLTLGSPTL